MPVHAGGVVGTFRPARWEGPLCSRYHRVLVQMMMRALWSGRLVLPLADWVSSGKRPHLPHSVPHLHSRDVSSVHLIALLGELTK